MQILFNFAFATNFMTAFAICFVDELTWSLLFNILPSDVDIDLEMVVVWYADFVHYRRQNIMVLWQLSVCHKKHASHIKLMEDYFLDEPIFGPPKERSLLFSPFYLF